MKSKMLELSSELSKKILESESFSGNVGVTKFEDGTIVLQLTHYHNYYRYSNSFISLYSFNNENGLKKFKKQAIDCIEGEIFLEDLGREENE